MNWSRVKTILIFLFLSVDIVMAAYILVNSHNPNNIGKAELRNIVGIYKASGIEIDEKLISRKSERMGIVEVKNLGTDRGNLAKLFMPYGYTVEDDGTYSNGGRSLAFGENAFLYKNSEITPAADAGTDMFLKDFHIDTEGTHFSGDSMRQEINGKPVFETHITAEGGYDGISMIYGYWIIPDNSGILKKPPVRLKPVSGVLVDFLATNAYNKNGDRIVSIETGYSTGSEEMDTTHKLLSVIPAYKITAESGGYAVFDATGGELLYESESD